MRIKKAKNAYLYDVNSVKYYDLRDNSNIIGYSNKQLTTHVKDRISSSWNIHSTTAYHERMTALCRKLFGEGYALYASFSIEELFSRLFLYAVSSFVFRIDGRGFNSWLEWKGILPVKNSCLKKITVCETNEIYIAGGGDHAAFEREISSLKKEDVLILNYYWYPLPDIVTGTADIVILPRIYCGNFNHVFVLLKKGSEDFGVIMNALQSVDSLHISSSLKNYYLIRRMIAGYRPPDLKWKGFSAAGRVLVPDDFSGAKELARELFEKKIIINSDPPYYSYLPINLEEYQKKFLKKVCI